MYVDDRIGGLQGELNPQGLINSQIVIHSHAFWFAVTILKMATRQGIEPRPRDLESLVLPEHLQAIIWCQETGSNRRHTDFQSAALPSELSRHIVWYPRRDSNSHCTGFESVASYQLRYVGIIQQDTFLLCSTN